jgi:hypothetical protein
MRISPQPWSSEICDGPALSVQHGDPETTKRMECQEIGGMVEGIFGWGIGETNL